MPFPAQRCVLGPQEASASCAPRRSKQCRRSSTAALASAPRRASPRPTTRAAQRRKRGGDAAGAQRLHHHRLACYQQAPCRRPWRHTRGSGSVRARLVAATTHARARRASTAVDQIHSKPGHCLGKAACRVSRWHIAPHLRVATPFRRQLWRRVPLGRRWGRMRAALCCQFKRRLAPTPLLTRHALVTGRSLKRRSPRCGCTGGASPARCVAALRRRDTRLIRNKR